MNPYYNEDIEDQFHPHDNDSEKALIGCLLISNSAIETAGEILSSEDFYNEIHRKIYVCMEEMYNKSGVIEPLSLTKFFSDKHPEVQGGINEQYLDALSRGAPNPENIEFYAERLVNLSAKRSALDILMDCEREIRDSSDPSSKISEVVTRIDGIRNKALDKTVHSIDDLFTDRASYYEKKQKGEIKEEVLPTGLRDLDDLLNGGLRFRHFDILAARPAMGKTSLAVQFAVNAAMVEKIPVLIFSIEMAKEEIADKMISTYTKIPYRILESANLEAEDWDKMFDFSNAIGMGTPNHSPLVLVDDVTKDLHRMISVIRSQVRQRGVRFVIIDFLQLVSISGKYHTRDEQLGYAVNMLAYTAKTLNINILALSQLNRGVESRSDRRPMLSDLRESGNIEQSAWRVLSIYRDDYYNSESDEVGMAEISVMKGKISNTGKVLVQFDKECTRFSNLKRVSEF